MSKEKSNPLKAIEATCRACPKQDFCLFGKPAIEIIDSDSFQKIKIAAVSYVWVKRNAEVTKMCPKPEEVANIISALGKNQN